MTWLTTIPQNAQLRGGNLLQVFGDLRYDRKMTFGQVKESFEQQFEDFELFWFSKPIEVLKKNGLLSL
jgi:hypothetical protein